MHNLYLVVSEEYYKSNITNRLKKKQWWFQDYCVNKMMILSKHQFPDCSFIIAVYGKQSLSWLINYPLAHCIINITSHSIAVTLLLTSFKVVFCCPSRIWQHNYEVQTLLFSDQSHLQWKVVLCWNRLDMQFYTRLKEARCRVLTWSYFQNHKLTTLDKHERII